MAPLLGLVLLVTQRHARLSSRDWGSRRMALSCLLLLSFAVSVLPAWRNIIVAGSVSGLGLLALTMPRQRATEAESGAIQRSYRQPTLPEPTTFALALVAWMLVRNIAAEGLDPQSLVAYSMSFGLLLCLRLFRLVGRLSTGNTAQQFVVLIAVILLVSPLLSQPAWQACRPEKCSVVGQIFVGVFSSENAMAIFAAFALALVFCSSERNRVAQVGPLMIILLATGARTALLGLGVGVALAWIAARIAERSSDGLLRLSPSRSLAIALGMMGSSAALLGAASATTLSGRGRTWNAALEIVSLRSIAGAGSSLWVPLQEAGQLPQHFPHNQVLHLHFSGGWIATLLWAATVAALLNRAAGIDRVSTARRLLPIFVLVTFGMTEVVWNPATVDSLTVLLAAILLMSPDGGAEMSLTEPVVEARVSIS